MLSRFPGSAWIAAGRRAAGRTNGRDLFRLGLVLALLAGATAAVAASGFRLQHTASLPMGLYRDVRGAPPVRGAIGVWCVPPATAGWARGRGYLPRGDCPGDVQPIGKVVLAVGGDTIQFDTAGVVLNRVPMPNTRPHLRDAAGRPITPAPFGTYVLRPGDVWLWSPYTTRSLDSRYFGPVPVSTLVSVVRPVWTSARLSRNR